MNLQHSVMLALLPAIAIGVGARAETFSTSEFGRNARIRARLDAFDAHPEDVLNRRARVIENIRRSEVFGLDATAPYLENDSAANLVDELKYTDLVAMESAGLLRARLAEQPWSGDYWPVYRGMIAKRYAEDPRHFSVDWKANHDKYLEGANSTSIDTLSPAEKYDLLMGDSARALTKAMWEEGRPYYERFNTVEHWMGLCHGWAPASYMMPRPAHAIEALAADGQTRIRFYPDDLKALATLLWAKAPAETRFIGGRCNEKTPVLDENGRLKNPDCFDTNPGTWHLSAVNQLGHSRRSFVMDSAYDYQVWNQPLYSYSYSYFNPETREPVPSMDQAKTELKDFTKDKFQKYRSPDAVSIVGIAMDVTYMTENPPTHNESNAADADSRMTVTYLYDVELDQNGTIIGGEWYEKVHPDFLWSPVRGGRAQALGDRLLERARDRSRWDAHAPIPELWQRASTISSERGQPLARVIETLVTLSNAGL
ncbi:MAG: hypothetical protein HY074_11290 [Deltaproteobacteria bacterium]|nr:hypothetical protein [Deltaproteobacteria bacterium]